MSATEYVVQESKKGGGVWYDSPDFEPFPTLESSRHALRRFLAKEGCGIYEFRICSRTEAYHTITP